jgi:hypothetical protein
MKAKLNGLGRAFAAAFGVVVLATAAAEGQAPPPPSPEVAASTSCLCLQRSVSLLAGSMTAKRGELDAINRQLSDLDVQVASERPRVDVGNPDSIARFKALLERHDDAYRRSNGPIATELVTAVARYNEQVGEYNRDCANHPFDSALISRLQATLVCPQIQ